jgi:hypothetical protein
MQMRGNSIGVLQMLIIFFRQQKGSLIEVSRILVILFLRAQKQGDQITWNLQLLLPVT